MNKTVQVWNWKGTVTCTNIGLKTCNRWPAIFLPQCMSYKTAVISPVHAFRPAPNHMISSHFLSLLCTKKQNGRKYHHGGIRMCLFLNPHSINSTTQEILWKMPVAISNCQRSVTIGIKECWIKSNKKYIYKLHSCSQSPSVRRRFKARVLPHFLRVGEVPKPLARCLKNILFTSDFDNI